MSGAPHVACSDCERIRPGVVAQPVNTASSLAFVAVAAPIWRRAAAGGDRPWQVVAVAAAATGLGSVAYHGPGGRLARALHDATVVALVAVTAGAVARTRSTGLAHPSGWVGPGVTLAAGALLHATSRTGGPLCRPDSALQGHAGWHVLSALALAQLASRAASQEPS